MKNFELNKSRGATACIRAAYELFLDNIKTILRRLSLPALAVGISVSVCLTAYTPNKAINEWGLSHPTLTIALMTIAVVMAFLSFVWLTTATFTLLNEKNFWKNMRRCLMTYIGDIVYALLCIAFQLLCFNVIGQTLALHFADHATTALGVSYLTYLFLFLLLNIAFLPYYYSSTKYIYAHEMNIKDLFIKVYARGWKYLGHILLTVLLSSIIISLIILIVCAPFAIIFMAQASNQFGMLEGDPSGAPSYLLGLLLIVSVVTWSILAFVFVWYFFVTVFLYGSIEAKEAERANV